MDHFRFYGTELYPLEGEAWLWFECDDDGYVVRFIVLHEDGRRFRYDTANHYDEYGILPEKKHTFEQVKAANKERISRAQFETEWNRQPWTNEWRRDGGT